MILILEHQAEKSPQKRQSSARATAGRKGTVSYISDSD